MDKKLDVPAFLERNQLYILIFSAILALLSISFQQINNLDKSYAGYLAITICILSGILILVMLPKKNESFTMPTFLFFGGICAIAVIIFLTIIKAYNEEYNQILSLTYTIASAVIGGLIASRLFNYYLTKYKKRKLIHNLILLFVSILLWISFKSFINIPNYISNWKYNYFLILFLTGFGFITVLLGILSSAGELFKLAAKKVKLLIKTKPKTKKLKNLASRKEMSLKKRQRRGR